MSNRDLIVLQGVAMKVLEDYIAVYPSDAVEVERDINRLSQLCRTRGLGVFLLDLPAMGKHFDACLSQSLYSQSNLPLSGRRKPGSSMPKLFSGLLYRVFDSNSDVLLDNVDPFVVLTLRTLYGFAKGFVHECSETRTAQAVADFYVVEAEQKEPTLQWEGDFFDSNCAHDLRFGDSRYGEGRDGLGRKILASPSAALTFSDILTDVCDSIAFGFGEFHQEEWSNRHGPGAVSDLRQGVSKYTFPSWSDKLDRVFPYADNAFMHWEHWIDENGRPCSDLESPSKLLTVPKTAKGPRLIASEPVAHQWCQQKILHFLLHGIESGPLRRCISLHDQEPSRALVLEASHSRSHATIDLSAASDRVSCWLVERCFRRNPTLLAAFHSSRTRWIVDGTKSKYRSPGRLALRKFTTMGSACTFPVQSIVFAMVSIATILFEENRRVDRNSIEAAAGRVRVFGDDMIIPNALFTQVTSNLEMLGLRVNHAKSFSEGNFRESCGMDAFRGDDVTPARINRVADYARPASVRSQLDASNNFFMKGFWRTASFLESTLPPYIRKNTAVVATDSGHAGLQSFVGTAVHHLKRRWNAKLQRDEFRTIQLSGRVARAQQSEQDSLFQRFVERPAPDSVWEPGRVVSSSTYLALGWVPLHILSPTGKRVVEAQP